MGGDGVVRERVRVAVVAVTELMVVARLTDMEVEHVARDAVS